MSETLNPFTSNRWHLPFLSSLSRIISSLMEFWGIEVKPGQTVKCEPGDERVLHLSQASLGESKKEKGSENVPIFVKINNQKLVLGTLSTEKCAQIQYDIVFEKEFELSHGSKNTSVFFVGYKSIFQGYDSEDDFSDSESEEDLAIAKRANVLGNPSKIVAGKATAEKDASGKGDNVSAKVKANKAEIKEPIKDDKKVEDKDEDDSDDDDEDDSEEESDEDDEDLIEAPGGDSSGDDDDESSDEEGTPKKVESAKRKADSASKTPIPEKKAKLVTPAGNQKTGGDGKKSVHIATPYPAKQGGKPQKSPKSGGTVACKSCTRTFISEIALSAHTKAKHP